MNRDLVIREPVESEIPALVSMALRSFETTFRGTCDDRDLDAYILETYTEAAFAAELEDESSIFRIASTAAGEILGYAKLRAGHREPGVTGVSPIELQRLYVNPELKRSGIGSILISECLDIARTGGHDVVWLGVWEHNHPARRFYEAKGFSYCGSHEFVMGSDVQTDLLMQRGTSGI